MDVWSRDQLTRTKKREEKGQVKANCIKKPPGSPSIREVRGNLRFPLDITYHGRPLYIFYNYVDEDGKKVLLKEMDVLLIKER